MQPSYGHSLHVLHTRPCPRWPTQRTRVQHTADLVLVDDRHYATNAGCVVRSSMRVLDVPSALPVESTDCGWGERSVWKRRPQAHPSAACERVAGGCGVYAVPYLVRFAAGTCSSSAPCAAAIGHDRDPKWTAYHGAQCGCKLIIVMGSDPVAHKDVRCADCCVVLAKRKQGGWFEPDLPLVWGKSNSVTHAGPYLLNGRRRQGNTCFRDVFLVGI